jgi:hypothetical protein
MTNFEYKPISLEGPAFRLLRLLKGNSGPIQCQLFESKLTPPHQNASVVMRLYLTHGAAYLDRVI